MLRKFAAQIVVLMLIAIFIAPRQASGLEWNKLVDKEGGFTVLMPGKPTNLEQPASQGKSMKSVSAPFVIDGQKCTAAVAYYDSSKDEFGGYSITDAFKSAGAMLKQGYGHKILSERVVCGSFDFGKAIESIDREGKFWYQWYITKRDRLFIVGVIGPTEKIKSSPDVQKFLASFTLHNNVADRNGSQWDRAQWWKYSPGGAKFSILMPGTVVEAPIDDLGTSGDSSTVEALYSVAWRLFRNGSFNAAESEEYFKRMREYTLNTLMEIKAERRFVQSGLQVLELDGIRRGTSHTISVRLILSDHHTYTLICERTAGPELSQLKGKFFDSLKIVD